MDSENATVEPQEQVQPQATGTVETEKVGASPAPESAKAEKTASGSRPTDIDSLQAGMKIKGKVRNVVDFGAFIDIGVSRDGLAHISVLKQAGVEKTIKPGDDIEVVVRRVDLENNRISLTLPGVSKENQTSLKKLDINSVVKGKVVRLVDFGAFVDIGAQSDGLLHVSQMSSDYVRHPSEVVKVGDEVEVRILEIDSRRRRISLTMKEITDEAAAVQMQAVNNEPQERFPTAFEVAFQQARKRQRRRK